MLEKNVYLKRQGKDFDQVVEAQVQYLGSHLKHNCARLSTNPNIHLLRFVCLPLQTEQSIITCVR